MDAGSEPREDAAAWLRTWGRNAWLLLGILLLAGAVFWLLSLFSGVVVPLVLAFVIGALLVPVVTWLTRIGLPRQAGAALVLVTLAIVVVGSVWLVVIGLRDQGAQISTQLQAGFGTIRDWLVAQGIDPGNDLAGEAGTLTGYLVDGLGGLVTGLVSHTVALVMGCVIGVFILYYMLSDWHGITTWVGGRLGTSPETGAAIIDDGVTAVRRYFWSLTISAVVTAVLTGVAAWLLGVPLAFTIAIITLTTSYVPYLGAIFSGAFATLIALGSTDLRTAVILLAVILVVQNVVQTVVLARVSGAALELHPIVTLVSTIAGATIAGIIGATLATPATAAALAIRRRIASPAAVDDPE